MLLNLEVGLDKLGRRFFFIVYFKCMNFNMMDSQRLQWLLVLLLWRRWGRRERGVVLGDVLWLLWLLLVFILDWWLFLERIRELVWMWSIDLLKNNLLVDMVCFWNIYFFLFQFVMDRFCFSGGEDVFVVSVLLLLLGIDWSVNILLIMFLVGDVYLYLGQIVCLDRNFFRQDDEFVVQMVR